MYLCPIPGVHLCGIYQLLIEDPVSKGKRRMLTKRPLTKSKHGCSALTGCCLRTVLQKSGNSHIHKNDRQRASTWEQERSLRAGTLVQFTRLSLALPWAC